MFKQDFTYYTGCSLKWCSGFPGDYSDTYTKAQHEALKKELEAIANVSQPKCKGFSNKLCVLNGFQKNARKLLEEHGWILIAEADSAHGHGERIYLMGLGSWEPAGETKVVTKTVTKRIRVAVEGVRAKLKKTKKEKK